MLLCFFLHDTATTEIYTLSLHDALPIYRVSARAVTPIVKYEFIRKRGVRRARCVNCADSIEKRALKWRSRTTDLDRKSTRLNSSHTVISYAVFCLKKKKKKKTKSEKHK